ncbi:nucleotidyltransferase family protein [Candidatus Magnetaquicoccus inordinatus]|uniref:nucleotidyltransferase family protein n=1 Tax=Candidatus Magnetaquicoccus inordinatus TaxID=2496818 RepID=UPI00102B6D52|nr:nucleotidyltransferase family protein [Candidatus Magnetaquicoccus inordinatus]
MNPPHAMILAAGRGERLRPLTDRIPKPLIPVQGRPVLVYTLLRLAKMGITQIVINAHHLAEQLMEQIGNGEQWGVELSWSREEQCLDTGGGIVNALHLMDPQEPFLVVNGDILWNLDLQPLLQSFDRQRMDGLLGLVPPLEAESGDFLYTPHTHRLQRAKKHPQALTYAGILLVSPAALAPYPNTPFSLNRFFDDALQQDRLRGLPLQGGWADMGTPQRLANCEKMTWIPEGV